MSLPALPVTHTLHGRTHDDDEVDLIVEREDGGSFAFAFKAGRRVAGSDFAAMTKLRDTLGAQFEAGILFFLGERAYEYRDRLFALPLDRLCGPLAGAISRPAGSLTAVGTTGAPGKPAILVRVSCRCRQRAGGHILAEEDFL